MTQRSIGEKRLTTSSNVLRDDRRQLCRYCNRPWAEHTHDEYDDRIVTCPPHMEVWDGYRWNPESTPQPSEREPVGSIGSLETLAKDYARKWRAAEERKRELEKTLDSILRMCWHYKTESKAKLRLTMQSVYEAARKVLERTEAHDVD